jgi:hypothetical protein
MQYTLHAPPGESDKVAHIDSQLHCSTACVQAAAVCADPCFTAAAIRVLNRWSAWQMHAHTNVQQHARAGSSNIPVTQD